MSIDDDSKTSTDMRTASSPAIAVTAQERVDGSREKAMRNANVEQTDSKGVMEMSLKGDLFFWARRLAIQGGASLDDTSGWKLRHHHQLPATENIRCNMRPNMSTAIFRDGSEQGIKNRAVETCPELLEDELRDNSTFANGLDPNSEVWIILRRRNLTRRRQLKYLDVEERKKKRFDGMERHQEGQ